MLSLRVGTTPRRPPLRLFPRLLEFEFTAPVMSEITPGYRSPRLEGPALARAAQPFVQADRMTWHSSACAAAPAGLTDIWLLTAPFSLCRANRRDYFRDLP